MKKITTIIFAVIYTANIIAQVPNYVPTNGLVGWWPFNGNANDESGNGNNGSVISGLKSNDRFGNAFSSYYLNGLTDYITVPSISSMMPNRLTLSVWVKIPSNYTGNNGIGPIIRARFYGYVLWFDLSNGSIIHILHHNSSATTTTTTPNNINDNQWHQIVGTFDGTTNKLYLDGQLISTKNTIANSNLYYVSDGLVAFGRDGNNPSTATALYQGHIDDIGIWNRALTQQEITTLYNSCVNNLSVTPINNNKMIGTNATFTAMVSDPNPSYIWQSDLGQGFQTLNNIGKYSGTTTNTMSVSNVQLSNHMVPIRAISTSGTCKDTSNIAYVKITDTCITKINDTIKVTKYDTIKVMDTLVINATLSGVSAPNNSNRLIVYPNPAKDHITIDYGVFSRMSGYMLKIVNTLGQTVFSSLINQQSSYINLSTWTGKGMYNVQIFDPQNNLIENRKIVLQ